MKKAFTLAEVLITLAIVGIVATMTIPSLSNSYQKKVLTTQLQKAYAEVSQAAANALLEGNGSDFNKLRVVKNHTLMGSMPGVYCDISKCLNYDVEYNVNGHAVRNAKDFLDQYSNKSCHKGESGWTLCIGYSDNGDPYAVLDANGSKSPNVYGADFYLVRFSANGKISGPDAALSNVIANDWDIDMSSGFVD
jgi:prepilin-type N-terminal cleavage/methylation domain-containing protein